MILLLTYQKVKSNLTLGHNAHIIPLTPSGPVAILSSHITIRGVSRLQYDILREGDHIHITFPIVYYYNCSILLLVIIVNLLLCLTCKLNFTIGLYVWDKNSTYKVHTIQFQTATGGLGTHTLWILTPRWVIPIRATACL